MEVSSATSPRITIQVPPEPMQAIEVPVVNARKLSSEGKLLLALKISTIMNLQFLQALKALSNNQSTEQAKPLPDFPPEVDAQPTLGVDASA